MIAQESSANFVGVTVHIQWFFKNFQMWANLGHQIVLRHKYCESPAQMRLVFKYVKYLPGREKGIWNRWVGQFDGSSIFIFRRKERNPTCDESRRVRRCGTLADKLIPAWQRYSPENINIWTFRSAKNNGCWNCRSSSDHCKCELTLMETLLGKYLLLLRRHAAPSNVCLV